MPHFLGMGAKAITVVELTTFRRQVERLLSPDEHEALIDYLAFNPYAGVEIPGTGGVRKVRFGLGSKGKSGGARVIYYVYNDTMPLYALLIYGKGEKTDLSPEERRTVAALAEILKAGGRRT